MPMVIVLLVALAYVLVVFFGFQNPKDFKFLQTELAKRFLSAFLMLIFFPLVGLAIFTLSSIMQWVGKAMFSPIVVLWENIPL